jgi:hypothetical protein
MQGVISEICRTQAADHKYIHFITGKTEGRNFLGDLDVDRRIILKLTLEK